MHGRGAIFEEPNCDVSLISVWSCKIPLLFLQAGNLKPSNSISYGDLQMLQPLLSSTPRNSSPEPFEPPWETLGTSFGFSGSISFRLLLLSQGRVLGPQGLPLRSFLRPAFHPIFQVVGSHVRTFMSFSFSSIVRNMKRTHVLGFVLHPCYTILMRNRMREDQNPESEKGIKTAYLIPIGEAGDLKNRSDIWA